MMRHGVARALSGTIVLSMALLGGPAAYGAPLPAAKGKLKTRTGTVAAFSREELVVNSGKRGELRLSLVPGTQVTREKSAEISRLRVGALIRLEGRGGENQFHARRLILLSPDEKWRQAKQGKTGPAFGPTPRKAELKAKVASVQPLRAENRFGQKFDLLVGPETTILADEKSTADQIETGDRVRVRYRDQEAGKVAEHIRILVPAAFQEVRG